MAKRIVVDLSALISAVEQARATRPSRRLESAYEWLVELNSVEFDADGCLIVDSATWSHSWYRVDEHSCSCPAHRPCWHQAAYTLVQDTLDIARENVAIDQAARYSEEYIDACYEEFEPVYLAGIAGVATSTHTAQPTINYRAAVASGAADLWT